MDVRFLQCRLVDVYTFVKEHIAEITVRTETGTKYEIRITSYSRDSWNRIPFCFNTEEDGILCWNELECKTSPDSDLLIPIHLKRDSEGKTHFYLVYNNKELKLLPRDWKYVIKKDHSWEEYFSRFGETTLIDESIFKEIA